MNQKELKNNRIQQLLAFLSQSPDDPFLHYALGTEYAALGEISEAEKYFQHLVENHPDYVATYYHFARLKWEKGEAEKALEMVRTGMQKAELAGEKNAWRELNALLAEMED